MTYVRSAIESKCLGRSVEKVKTLPYSSSSQQAIGLAIAMEAHEKVHQTNPVASCQRLHLLST